MNIDARAVYQYRSACADAWRNGKPMPEAPKPMPASPAPAPVHRFATTPRGCVDFATYCERHNVPESARRFCLTAPVLMRGSQ